ncbi:amidoligase family protein [Prevotella sp. HUN102]|uniref:amidoligase family protein n=1 Tax=Prevotella sp. HUN102 TaxID=1392486 RepID=UPI0004908E63|nr:amidoligase family protein [Prevotella sp. HUN102]
MNEQIQNILNENGTKTSKIQKLLALGLTRRQVADLAAGGNYGFVQNVYKRMMQGLTTTAAQAAATVIPQLDYTFNRNFGVEIEAYNCTRIHLASELSAAGINVQVEGYNHTDHTDHWKIVTDGSLSGNNTFELVSPILHGEQGLEELEKVCWVLDLCNVKVNDSCGLHVHMDAAEFDLQTWKNLILAYKRLEGVIDHFMPRSRRNNTYCKGLTSITEAAINRAANIGNLRAAFHNNRYHKVNLEAYARHRTVEFRQHGGTTNFTKMSAWIHFLAKMITFAKQGTVQAGTTLRSIPFLTESEKLYFKLRTKKLAV